MPDVPESEAAKVYHMHAWDAVVGVREILLDAGTLHVIFVIQYEFVR